MTSGPYRSNLLRFAIAQYRRGIARHRSAVRTVGSGAATGAVIAFLPVYAVASVSRLASQWVRQRFQRLLSHKNLPGVKAKVAKLLDFSDFEETSLTVPDRIALETNKGSAEQVMAQTLTTVGDCLSVVQINLLSSVNQRPAGLLKRMQGLFAQKSSEVASSDRITGVASDLERRSLVLVKGYTVAWHGLSAQQQSKLQKKIAALLSGECVDNALALPSEADLALSEKGHSLAWSVRSFWVEVLRIMAWLQRGRRSDVAFQLASGSAQLPGSNRAGLKAASPKKAILWRASLKGDSSERARLQVATTLPVVSCPKLGSSTDSSKLNRWASAEMSPSDENIVDGDRCLEAAVITVEYVEHPLETVLKWVDRLLLRLEDLWHMLKQWLLSLRRTFRGEK